MVKNCAKPLENHHDPSALNQGICWKMQDRIDITDRPTLASRVFEQLYEDIDSLKLLPGTKLSEVEVARKFGVSPQPVRDAFHRLSSMDLLLVQPQRASKVRGFSLSRIEDARFIRLSIELEVCRRACEIWDKSRAATLQKNLEKQKRCVEAVNAGRNAIARL